MAKQGTSGPHSLVTRPKGDMDLAVVETDPNVLEMDKLVGELCVISCDSGKVLRFLKNKNWRKAAVKDMKALVDALVAATGRAQIVLHEISKPETPQRPILELPAPKSEGLKHATGGSVTMSSKGRLAIADGKSACKPIAA